MVRQSMVVFLIGMLLIPMAALAQDNTTQGVIDGKDDGWSVYPVVGTDPAGDQVAGSPDIGEVQAFSNDRCFYLLVRLHADGQTDHYDILMDVDGGDYDFQLSVWPDRNEAVFAVFPVTRNMQPLEGVSAAQDDVIEVKMPLAAVGGRPVKTVLVQTFLGDKVGDMAPDMNSPVVDEVEPISVSAIPPEEFTTRPGHVFVTGSHEPASYLYRAFIQIPVGVAWVLERQTNTACPGGVGHADRMWPGCFGEFRSSLRLGALSSQFRHFDDRQRLRKQRKFVDGARIGV
jgi:hypothetical protein